MLEGKNINLRLMEKEDLPQLSIWVNSLEFMGKYNPIFQSTRSETEKMLEGPLDVKPFFIEKKDGTKIGYIGHSYVMQMAGKQLEIDYSLIPAERGKGYCTEVVRLMVDYLFLSKAENRIQAQTEPTNIASQRVLEKAGFKKEGILRSNFFIWGEWLIP